MTSRKKRKKNKAPATSQDYFCSLCRKPAEGALFIFVNAKAPPGVRKREVYFIGERSERNWEPEGRATCAVEANQ